MKNEYGFDITGWKHAEIAHEFAKQIQYDCEGIRKVLLDGLLVDHHAGISANVLVQQHRQNPMRCLAWLRRYLDLEEIRVLDSNQLIYLFSQRDIEVVTTALWYAECF